MKKLFRFAVMFTVVYMAVAALAAPVALDEPDLGLNYATNLGLASQNGDVRDTAVDIVKYLMTFLGIIAVVVILIGGFRWMTAGGNEDKIASAKKTITAGAIGLVVILAAFAIVTFVINQLLSASKDSFFVPVLPLKSWWGHLYQHPIAVPFYILVCIQKIHNFYTYLLLHVLNNFCPYKLLRVLQLSHSYNLFLGFPFLHSLK